MRKIPSLQYIWIKTRNIFIFSKSVYLYFPSYGNTQSISQIQHTNWRRIFGCLRTMYVRWLMTVSTFSPTLLLMMMMKKTRTVDLFGWEASLTNWKPSHFKIQIWHMVGVLTRGSTTIQLDSNSTSMKSRMTDCTWSPQLNERPNPNWEQNIFVLENDLREQSVSLDTRWSRSREM